MTDPTVHLSSKRGAKLRHKGPYYFTSKFQVAHADGLYWLTVCSPKEAKGKTNVLIDKATYERLTSFTFSSAFDTACRKEYLKCLPQ